MAKRYLPDIMIVDKETGKEVVVVEVKASETLDERSIEQLKMYMRHFYAEAGIVVTPTQTCILTENFDGELVQGEAFETKLIFGDFESIYTPNWDRYLEDFVFYKLLDAVNEINNDQQVESLQLLSKDLPYLLKGTNVIRDGVR